MPVRRTAVSVEWPGRKTDCSDGRRSADDRYCISWLATRRWRSMQLIVTNERLTFSNQCWSMGVGVVTSRTASCSSNYRRQVWACTYGIKEYLYCYLIHFCNTIIDNNRSVSFGFVEMGNPALTMSLHYLVKYLFQNDRALEEIEANCHVRFVYWLCYIMFSAISKSVNYKVTGLCLFEPLASS